MIHLWIKRLKTFRLLRIFFHYFVSDIVIYTEEITRSASWLYKSIRFFGITSKNVEILYLNLGQKDETGRAIFYKVQKNTYSLVNDLFNDKVKDEKWLPTEYKRFKDEWLKVLRSSCILSFQEKVEYFCIIENLYNKKKIDLNGVKNVIIFIEHDVMGTHIQKSYQFVSHLNTKIALIPNWRYNFVNYPMPGIVVFMIFRGLVAIFKKNARGEISKKVNGKGVIFEEYISNIFQRYPKAGNLFWYDKSEIEPERVILYFDRPDSPCREKSISEIESYGFGWIDMANLFLNVKHPVRLIIKCLSNSRNSFPRNWNEFNVWRWGMFVRYSIVLECYREVYRDYNVRAVHQTHEWWPYTIINSLAIKMEDGIFVENLRSITAFPFPWFFCGFADLVFSWGQYHDGFFHAHNFSYKYLVQTGMVEGDGLDETESYRAKSIRSELDPSVKFVITLFDSSHGSNAPYSTSSMIYFYKNLLSLVLEKNDWGVIIKPKNDSYFNVITLNDDFNTIKKILIKQGRCVKLPASVSPSVASMAGEITVCYGINSAGIISYLNGGPPTLHFDMNGNLEHPLYYVGGKDRVIFRSFDKVCYALEEIRNGDTKLGNHSEWIGLFDAFLDGKGRYRTGEIIGMYMKYRENGLGRDSALKKAIENYTLKWGHEKVSTPMAKQEHIGNELWYRAMEKTML